MKLVICEKPSVAKAVASALRCVSETGKWYPLMEWGWDRAACMQAIEDAGLSQPGKSSCFFCPSMRAEEIIHLRGHHPDLFRRAIALEDNARPNLKTVQGLGRSYSWKERFGKEFCEHGNC